MLGSNAVQLTVIGRPPPTRCPALEAELSRVRWLPSLPHSGILDEMAMHDVFVFPSLFEGFGLVLLEAMSAGLPIISTPHTAAPDLITDGREGYIVPIRDSITLADRMDRLRRDPELNAEMGNLARLRTAEFTWENYAANLVAAVRSGLVT